MIFEFIAASFVVVAWVQHTPESAEAAEDFRNAMDDVGLLDKQAAIEMKITPPELSRQLAGRESLSYWRLKLLPKSFRLALLKREAARLGAVVLTHSEREFILAVSRLPKRRMAKMFPDLFSEERRVS